MGTCTRWGYDEMAHLFFLQKEGLRSESVNIKKQKNRREDNFKINEMLVSANNCKYWRIYIFVSDLSWNDFMHGYIYCI